MEVLVAPLRDDDRVDLPAMVHTLYEKGIHSILVEGGSTVQGTFFDSNLVDKIYAFIGAKVIGGVDSKTSVGGLGADDLSESVTLDYETAEIHDNNVYIEAYNRNRRARMFTGIIEELGTIGTMDRRPDSMRLTVFADTVLVGTRTGDSIAVNGVCLTVTAMTDASFCADVMHETIRRSSSKTSAADPGSILNGPCKWADVWAVIS